MKRIMRRYTMAGAGVLMGSLRAGARNRSSETPLAVTGRTIGGYAALYNVETVIGGWFREVLRPGAFRRALAERQDAACLFNHNADNLLGRVSAGTLVLREDDTGLYMECDVAKTPLGDSVLAMIARRDLFQQSFSFVCTKETVTHAASSNELDLFEIEDVDLYDVGPVTYPAYEDTSIDVLDDVLDEVLRDRRARLQKLRAGAGAGAGVWAAREAFAWELDAAEAENS